MLLLLVIRVNFQVCHADDSNRVTTSEHVRVPEACLEYESTTSENSESRK